MPLPAGKKLGPYEIVALMGAGGMGEVYRARDPRIGREVAVKILPAAFCADPERLRRFTQEVKAAGVLNHPNIVAIYDVGTEDGAPYLVCELLDGATLREGLEKGPLPPRKALEYAIQIAEGLACAHAKGIIHRDLKPENIFVCRDGSVKILDFGLAKLTEPNDAPLEVAATVSSDTRPGLAMGTAGYMSPEQVRGLAVDQRSDIFNFGALLYEMLSGVRAFRRDTYADTASAILKEDPSDLITVNPKAPADLGRVINHCLEKNPEERYQSIRDLGFELKCVSERMKSPSGASAAIPMETARARKRVFGRRSPKWMAMGACLMVIAGALGWWVGRRTGRTPLQTPVSVLRLTDFQGLEEYPAVSPDGNSVAFTADISGTRQIWVRLIAGGAPLQLTHDAVDHVSPRWSSDLASVIYYTPPQGGQAEGTVWQVAALGGTPRRLVSSVSDADLSHDGTKLAFFRLNEGHAELVVTDREGSNPRVLSRTEKQYKFAHVRWSPDDLWIGYKEAATIWTEDIFAISSSGGDTRQLTHENSLVNGFAWTSDSSGVVYSTGRESTILYLPTMRLWLAHLAGGMPQKLTFDEASYEFPDVDRRGRLFVSRRRMKFDLWKFPVTATPEDNVRKAIRLTRQTGQVQTPTASPDDKEIAFLSDSGGHGNVWVLKLDNGELRQITYERDPAVILGVPIWSPDGTQIAFASTRNLGIWSDVGYWLIRPDGSGLRRLIQEGSWGTWSGDSRWMYYNDLQSNGQGSEDRIKKQALEGGNPVTVRSDEGMAPAAAWDGTALYFVVPLQGVNGLTDYEIRVARPENGPTQTLARIPELRVPDWQGLQPVLSHNGQWLALTLNDKLGTNLWLLPTAGGAMKQVTDFGQIRSYIARRVSWSADDRFIYAALGEGDADIIAFDGLLPK